MSIPTPRERCLTVADLTTSSRPCSRGLVSTESVQAMITMEGESTGGYGLGIMRYPFGDLVAYGHNGGIDGFRSHVSYLPGLTGLGRHQQCHELWLKPDTDRRGQLLL
ncbi:MAG: hypothetical protein CM15mP74_02890 [Halieaceae bacterium]|nr:MAG: hypothetical protein CM15mP74_02890 [Halieaceae bacterium]